MSDDILEQEIEDVLSKEVLDEIERIGKASFELFVLIGSESVINKLLESGKIHISLSDLHLVDEMFEWYEFTDSIKFVLHRELDMSSTLEELIESELFELYGAVSRLCALDFDRSYLSSLGKGFNIFEEYGYEELANKLEAFIWEYLQLKNG